LGPINLIDLDDVPPLSELTMNNSKKSSLPTANLLDDLNFAPLSTTAPLPTTLNTFNNTNTSPIFSKPLLDLAELATVPPQQAQPLLPQAASLQNNNFVNSPLSPTKTTAAPFIDLLGDLTISNVSPQKISEQCRIIFFIKKK
jgi:hypothetical protein